jgi:hypothetical protein
MVILYVVPPLIGIVLMVLLPAMMRGCAGR